MKKIVTFVLACLFFSLSGHVSANTFKDIPANSELHLAVSNLHTQKVIAGYEDATFRPNKSVTRGQLAKMIAISLQLTTKEQISTFKDVPNTHANFAYIQALVERKIISGYPDGTFKPNVVVTRSQAAKMITAAFSVKPYDATLPFSDVKQTSERYHDIQALYFNGITAGTSATTYSPAKNVTRGQAALFIFRALQLKNGAAIHEISINTTQASIIATDGYFYKTVIVGNKIRILPLVNGTGKLFIKDGSDYTLYQVNVSNKRVTADVLEWLNYVNIKLSYYTLDALQLSFKPSTAVLTNSEGVVVPNDQYSIGADNNGVEIGLFVPGRYTLTLSNSNGSSVKTYTIVSSITSFNITSVLYLD